MSAYLVPHFHIPFLKIFLLYFSIVKMSRTSAFMNYVTINVFIILEKCIYETNRLLIFN
jgi:hypothetical protein